MMKGNRVERNRGRHMEQDRYGSNRGGNWGEWLGIVILLMIPNVLTWLLGFGLLIRKLKGGKAVRGGTEKRHPYYIQREQAAQEREQVTWERRQVGPSQGHRTSQRVGGAPAAPQPTPKKGKKADRGTGLWFGGVSLSAFSALILVSEVAELISSGSISGGDISSVALALLLLAGGAGMVLSGLGRRKRSERYINYVAYIGANREVDLNRMATSMDVSRRKLVKDLRYMLAKGILPTGYIDLAEGKLYLTEMGYRPQEPVKAPPPEPAAPKTARQEEHAILREIRQINDDISGELMSAKIDRIEEITRKILAYQDKYPQRASQLRSFLNYYLPTTLKILRSYAQLDAQGVEGENISAAKVRIEGMMDQVVAGFETQLDKLFQGEAMDITTDVEVLENMLRSDGLSGGDGITLEL